MVVAAPSMDATILNAVGEAALGINLSTHWNTDFDNPANKRFVAEFQKKHNRVPTYYASQSYDTALAIAAALKGTGGKIDNAEAFRKEMLKANFDAVRGAFKFGSNQHPIQDWWAAKVDKDAQGKPAIVSTSKVLTNHGDVYAKECKL
jgi:branched-chain amino acid transport system substrate-binding protein